MSFSTRSPINSVRPPIPAFTVRALHCPPVVRIDEALGREVNKRLMRWVAQIGLFSGRRKEIRDADIGRYTMLCHVDTQDAEHLLLQAQCLAALIAVDDYYCDDQSLGACPEQVAARLSFAMAAIDPVYLPSHFGAMLETQMTSDPVLVGLRAYMRQVDRRCTPSQVARVRQSITALFMSMAAESAWRVTGNSPTVAEYLVSRRSNSFGPCLALVDAVAGYELPANEYSRPQVHHMLALLALATTLVNDLYSAHKEYLTETDQFKLLYLLAATQHCSLQQAIDQIADLHDHLMCEYEAAERLILTDASPLLRRFLAGLKAWAAGNLEWHRSTARYQTRAGR